MQILLGLILGAVVGLSLHFLMPHRDTRGIVLAPMLGAAVAGVVWTGLTWLGFAVDNPWLWLAALVVPAAITWPVLAILGRARLAHDARERIRLRIA